MMKSYLSSITQLRVLALLLVWALVLPAAPVQAKPRAQEFPRPERPIHNGVDAVKVDVIEATNKGLAVEYHFPAPQFWLVQEKEQVFVQMAIPGMEQAYGPVGRPAIPFYTRLVALPKGAAVTVSKVAFETRPAVDGVLYPAQPEALDAPRRQEEGGDEPLAVADFIDPPFVIDRDFYAGDTAFPPALVTVERLGSMGRLDLARVSVATGRFGPAQQKIQPLASVRFALTFEGGEGYFLNRLDLSPFNRPPQALLDLTLNAKAITDFVGTINQVPQCLGYEYLIITPASLRTAADDLAAAKRADGIFTNVVETGTGAGQIGTTTTAIKSYIQGVYNNNCRLQLKYLLLLGDAELIPPWYNRTYANSQGNDTPGSDLEYALLSGADLIPDLAVGRLPVDTLTQADTVVAKIINYENTPPNNATFYEDATIASYFQCCRPTVDFYIPLIGTIPVAVDGVTSRSFIETAELVRDELRGAGYSVKRIYTTNDNYHDDPTNGANFYDATVRDTTPTYYYNLAPLPSFIGPGGSYAWDGSTSQIQDEINAGTFLLIHRDHGNISGWGSPSFKESDHAALTNGNLTPVVYSINCASGLFDNETRNPANDAATYNTIVNDDYWAEDLLRLTAGGAVAVIGDTRNSPTWANSAFLRGLVDATWPGTVPEGGPTSITRLGDILNYGKIYLLGQVGVAQSAGSVSQAAADGDVLMYHLYGDPTMKMWTANPNPFTFPGTFIGKRTAPRTWTMRYDLDGATITAMQGDSPLSRGIVVDGKVQLQMIDKRQAGQPVTFVVDHPAGITTVLPLEQVSGTVSRSGGGKLASSDGRIQLTFPPAAVAEDIEIVSTILLTETASLLENHTTLSHFAVNAADAADNEVTSFAAPLQMDLCVDGAQRQNLDAAFVAYFDENTDRWVEIDSQVDLENGCVTAAVDHLTEFALLRDDSLSFGEDNSTIFLPIVTK
jgi:hypothetical protein